MIPSVKKEGWCGDMKSIVKKYFTNRNFSINSYNELRETTNLIYKKENIIQFKTEISDFKEQEIWTESPCVFIHKRKINEVLNKLF
ncbi:MAG: hypothetical protein HPY57_14125 [Ignavibacteria bacterium]|nr:hypothetical protein [Ignavibacteria bacterium]